MAPRLQNRRFKPMEYSDSLHYYKLAGLYQH